MDVSLRLLILEDSEDDAALLVDELQRGGYDVSFERVDTPDALGSAVQQKDWDLVISDYSMPHFSGLDALSLLRARGSNLPFIFVSGTTGEETAVAALKTGAQDYLIKSNLKRLVPAVQRELREASERREHKRLEQQVEQLQKFEAIGRLAGGIAHDFNNAIGAILGWAEMGCEEAQPGSRSHERFQNICDQAQRAGRLTSQLLAFARRQVLQPRKLSVNSLIEDYVTLLRKIIGEHIEVSVLPAQDRCVAIADPAQMEQVLMNLCLNARDAMPSGGQLVLGVKNVEIGEEYCRDRTYARPGRYVLLSVSDTGSGMDAATVEHIFEPFFTTKEMGKGTGLGLATVYGIVKQHNGFIHVYSELQHGTSFRIYLPASSGVPDPLEAKYDEPARKGTETILLAEDHDGLRQSAREMLEALGYRVILAANGTEAVQLFKNNCDQIDLVILDVVMPGLTGPAAYSEMSAIRPNLGVIFATGYTAEAAHLVSMVEKGATLLQKPYSPKSLSRMIGTVLDRTHAA